MSDLVPVASDLPALSTQQVVHRMTAIADLMRAAMVTGVDYGSIPGTGSKPTLLKPGAEKLSVMFQLDPQYKTEKTFSTDGHLTVETYCTVYHAPTGNRLGGASALCSTREAKYAYRKGERVCPNCGKPAIIKGKQEYGGGWLCFKKKDGCGSKFGDADERIISQQVGRMDNPDLADSYNTVLRIAEKRALVAAIRQVTGASAIFDEEIPDRPEAEPPAEDHMGDDEPEIRKIKVQPKQTPKQWADDLCQRIRRKDDEFAGAGKSQPTELLAAVEQAWDGAGLSDRPDQWTQEQQKQGIAVTTKVIETFSKRDGQTELANALGGG